MGVEIDPQLVENLKEKRFPTVKRGFDPEQVGASWSRSLRASRASRTAAEARLPRRVRLDARSSGSSGSAG